MCAAPGATPRKMLPPPMTTATSTPRREHFRHFGNDAINRVAIDAVAVFPHQRFAAQLEQDALVGRSMRHILINHLFRKDFMPSAAPDQPAP